MTRAVFHPKAWLAWLAAAAAVSVSIANPFGSVAILLALVAVAGTFRSPGPEGRTAMLFVKFGLVVIAVRAVLFGLTGHAGDTTLFSVPEAALPRWLGGFTIGGRITGEVLAQQVAEGLKIAAFLASFGVFLSAVETYRVLRMLPKFLFEAGLVVGIAVTFVPSLLRTAADVRDAQRLRGHRVRGVRSLRPLVMPVLAGALERSLTLAESMESRGFGRGADAGHGREVRARLLALAGLAALCAGGGFALAGRSWQAMALAGAGAAAVTAGLRMLSSAVSRTRLRAERVDGWDRAMIAAAAALVLLSVAVRSLEAAGWYAYPRLSVPIADVRVVALGAALAFPVALAPVRRAWLRASERRSARGTASGHDAAEARS